MSANYIKGEWRVVENSWAVTSITDTTNPTDHEVVALLSIPEDVEEKDQDAAMEKMMARARLIAAAPELFDIANRLAKLNAGLSNSNSSAELVACELSDLAIEVVKKITGEQS